MSIRSVLAAAAILTAVAEPGAENWPGWRGPAFNGASGEKNLPIKWSPTQNIAWRMALPAWSGSTPVVWGDRVFVSVADGGSLFLWAIDRTRGEPVWKKHVSDGDVKLRKHNMSSPSPVTDGQRVWVMTGTGIIKAFDHAGTQLWARDLQREYGAFGLNWGYGSSPLLHEGGLYVQVLHGMRTDDPSYLLKIDPATGKTIWRVERPTTAQRESPDAYSTPAPWRSGPAGEIVISGGDVVTGHDPATGKELWRAGGLNPLGRRDYRIVNSPVVVGDTIFASSENMVLALKPGGRGDVSKSHRLWFVTRGPDVPTPVSDGTYLYIVDDRGLMSCLEAKTGRGVYGPTRLRPGTYSASPVLADGKIYATSEDGVTSVVRAGPKFELLAENEFDDFTLSSPAVSEGQIFIRTAGHLWAIGQRAR